MVATVLLALTPVTIHAPIPFVNCSTWPSACSRCSPPNLLLLRHTPRPIHRLVERMRTVDLLRPGQRLPEDGGVEARALVRAVNQMLERLESERRETGPRRPRKPSDCGSPAACMTR